MSTALTRFTRFDLITIATTQPLRIVLPLVFTVVFSVTLPVPGLGVVIGAIVASVTASVPFQGDERGRLDTLYAIAPVSRNAVVLGRYLSMLLFAVLAIGVGTATMFVIGVVRHQQIGWPLIATMLLVAFGCVSIALAVQLPWFFRLGFSRGRPMIYIPVGVIAVVGFIAGQTGLLDGSGAPGDIAAPSVLDACAILIVGIVLLIASAGIASSVYRRREL